MRSRVACAGEALGNGALDVPPAQDEGSEEPPRPHLCMGLLSSESMFPGVSTSRVGPFRLGVHLCFAQTDASGHSQTQTRIISLRELVA